MKAQIVARARSFLFVPADRPDRFLKAANSGADAIILDLEDAVAPDQKAQARAELVAHWASLAAQATPVLLRLNADEALADAHWLASTGIQPAAVIWPKAESAAQIQQVCEAVQGCAVIPLIESVAGYDAVSEIASVPGVLRLAFGHLDFSLDANFQISADQSELAPVRFAIAMASRRHGLSAPIDGVTVDLKSAESLQRDVQRAVAYGMNAKLCIHPSQIEPLHQLLTPSAEDLEWARRVLHLAEQAQGAAVQLDGKMVDAPVIKRAQSLLGFAT